MPSIESVSSPWHSKGWWTPPTNIVLHSAATTLNGLLATFGPSSTRKVSSHFTVDGASGRIIQHVSMEDRAWHALSANDFSYGVETIDGKPWGDHPESTYPLVAWLVRYIARQHLLRWGTPLAINDTVVGPHSRWVATACPANLDWPRVIREAGGTMFDPRSNPADDEYIKQTVRNIVLGEPHLTASALQRALKPHYTLGKVTQPRKGKRTAAEARKGHGRGQMKGDVK